LNTLSLAAEAVVVDMAVVVQAVSAREQGFLLLLELITPSQSAAAVLELLQ
jgi:hypothetical protein